jgi:molecular chaperone GrpE
VEELLADFRAWLAQAAAAEEALPEPPAEPVDLATVVGQFTALRHEVNLQTRAVRSQQEQAGQALDKLQEALDLARRAGQDQGEATLSADEARSVVKALLDAHDALGLAEREVARIQAALAELRPFPDTAEAASAPAALPPLAEAPRITFPWWARWLGLHRRLQHQISTWETWLDDVTPRYRGLLTWQGQLETAQARLSAARQAAAADFTAACTRLRHSLDALLAGYAMSLQRLQRTLEQLGLEPVAAVGEPFDPEVMEVVEVVVEPERFGAIVLDEVRRGYVWRGRVLRYAQVRVAKGGAGEDDKVTG